MRKLAVFLRPYKLQAAAAVVLVFVQSIADLLLPRLMAEIVDRGVVAGDRSVILSIGGAMLAVALAGAAAAVLSAYFAARTALSFGRDLRASIFERAESFSLREFNAFGTSTLITRATNDAAQMQNIVQAALHMLTRAPLMALGSLGLALATDVRLTLVLLASLPLLVGTTVIVARFGLPMFKLVQAKTDALSRVLREGLTGIRVVRAFNREDAERDRFGAANEDLTLTALRAQRVMAVLMPAMMVLMNLSSVAVVWFGGRQAASGQLRIGDMMAFLQYAMHILFSLMILSHLFVMLPRAQVSAERIVEVLETVPSVADPELPAARPRGAAGSAAPQGVLEFRNVSFKYPGAEERALRDVSFTARPGETTAIIGGTGSGKSTLLSLVPRFFDAESGAVLLDGIDVRDYPLEELRSRLGYVPQKAVLFTGTVADNLRFGREDAAEAELRLAARTAQAEAFVEALEGGYEGRVSQGGGNFSGGQKQRLSIARALVRDPDLYLFDDSFSALDFRTDARLRDALSESLRKRPGGATVLVVAQRIGTIMNADRIVVLDEGAVAGIGTHRQLIESCPVYREIAESQLEAEAAV
jgi:ATP-binding cassette subfamily B protein